jgi:Glycosyl transferase family 11
MKRIVILQHGPSTGIHGQLANQLWNFISVYAYAVERNVPLGNYSFFEYSRYFSLPVRNSFVDWVFFRPFNVCVKFISEKTLIPFWRKLYKLYVLVSELLIGDRIVFSGNTGETDAPYYLPPSEGVRAEFIKKEARIAGTLYLDGWFFRNPIGLQKHREAIREYFSPKKEILNYAQNFLTPLREKYAHIVGVHIRQGDYLTWKGGKYFVNQKRVREILDEYLAHTAVAKESTCFVIASDGPVELAHFGGLHTAVSRGAAVQDLFLLAQTDVVIGSDSSFGDFSAFYGNIPHIIFQNGPVDWNYYKGKKRYFENTYCTLVHY